MVPPHKDRINKKIAVRKRISHPVGCLKLHVGVFFVKLTIQPQNLVCRFADDFNVPYDRVLKKRTCKKRRLVDALRIGLDLGYRFEGYAEDNLIFAGSFCPSYWLRFGDDLCAE
jgi:hypothetical protein